MTLKPGVPIEIDGVSVDLLSTSGGEAFLEQGEQQSESSSHRGENNLAQAPSR